MINTYLHNNNKQILFGTNDFMVALVFICKAQLKAWDWSKKWPEIFFPFFRKEKEMNQRYEHRSFNHIFMNNLL